MRDVQVEANGDGRPEGRRLGLACVGLGGAVATTAVAGVELIRRGLAGTDGLPLAALDAEGGSVDLAPYENLVFGGWDLSGDDLASAALSHGVLDGVRLEAVKPALSAMRPWPAVGNKDFCRNASGDNVVPVAGHVETVGRIRADLQRFREENGLDGIVLVNIASTERLSDPALPLFATPESFEEGAANSDPAIGPAMLYAYAAILEGVPYVNFTPSVGADVPALVRLAEERGVPVAGKDGKTGQTMLKTVLAPALRSRALRVEGWFSTNILGNRDGEILNDPDSLASKVETKGNVLDDILGYRVEDHLVNINYYRPRGDNKEAWDNVDLVGFLGSRMQLKVNFLCGDSVLAAPLVVELARLSDLALRRGEGGVQEHLGMFFKAPMTRTPDAAPEHAFHRQEEHLLRWLAADGRANGQNGRNGGDPAVDLPPANVEAGEARDS
jgi:myo-inositol-1-phosphate synthase